MNWRFIFRPVYAILKLIMYAFSEEDAYERATTGRSTWPQAEADGIIEGRNAVIEALRAGERH